jgi:hypothetical protein
VDYNSLIRSLAVILGVILLVAVTWGAFKAVTEAKADYSPAYGIETLDTDIALATTIDSLEAHWNRRLNYSFKVDQDPLFLGRVIQDFSYAKLGFKERQERTEVRLSATIILPNELPMAIIKYEGKSLVLQEGDKFGDGYVVKRIRTKEVDLSKSGKSMTLETRPLDQFEEASQASSSYPKEW